MKRAVFFLLPVILMILLLAGCSRPGAPSSSTAPQTSPSQSAPAAGTGGESQAVSPTADPPTITKAYFQALTEKKFDRAWELLSETSKAKVAESIAYNTPRARLMLDNDTEQLRTKFFTKFLKGTESMYRRLVEKGDFREKSHDTVKAVVNVTLDGKTASFTLAMEKGQWKMDIFNRK